jgi:predicted GIY-YIG superfamily endonuclease
MRRDVAMRRKPHAVYRAYDADNNLLYVGCSVNPDRRLKDHVRTPWYPRMTRCAVEWHPNFDIGRSVERVAIETEEPLFNVPARVRARRSAETRKRMGHAA